MANPRKFSEKIALHNQKQAEETAAFEEIMREVMGATRNRSSSNVGADVSPTVTPIISNLESNGNHQQHLHQNRIDCNETSNFQNQSYLDERFHNSNDFSQPPPLIQQQTQNINFPQPPQHHLNIVPSFSATRAGSLPNVNQIGRQNLINLNNFQNHHANGIEYSKGTGIDLKSALNSLQEIKNEVRSDHCRRNTSPNYRSPNRNNSSYMFSSINSNRIHSVLNNGQLQSQNYSSTKRSQSPYSMVNENAYLSPPSADNLWRRTNSDSALHHSLLISETNHQNIDGLEHLIANNFNNGNQNASSPQNSSCNNSPGQTPSMMVDNSDTTTEMIFTNSSENTNSINWAVSQTLNNDSEKFLLSTSLPNQQHLRPRSCEVPGINIYPIQDDQNSTELSNNHHIPISSNTGSLPDLTNLHFPVPLNVPIDGDDQTILIMKMNSNHSNGHSNVNNSPYSNGPDSPYSPTSSHNSNLSPPPPCNKLNHQSINSNDHHNHRNQSPNRRQNSPGPSPSPTASRRRAHQNAINNMVIGGHRSPTSTIATNQQSMGPHRSTTPSDSCSGPTSPASQNISPSNSPELAMTNCNVIATGLSITTSSSATALLSSSATNPTQFSPAYSNQQQTNQLQHQLEQFRMNKDADPGGGAKTDETYEIDCPNSNLSTQSNVFYLDSNLIMNSHFNDSSAILDQHHQLQNQSQSRSAQQFDNNHLADQTSSFSNDLFFEANHHSASFDVNLNPNDSLSNNPTIYATREINGNENHTNSIQQHITNSSHCTTPQTPSSIPDIILTGPNNLDETLQTSQDLIKDLNNMGSFDSDIFVCATDDIRNTSFDSFDLDSLQMLNDIDGQNQTIQ